jgi:threonine synthase
LIQQDAKTVVVLTGTGLKTPNTITQHSPLKASAKPFSPSLP